MIVPFRVNFEEAAAATIRSLSAAQQKTVDRKLAAAADFASLRQHVASEDWVEIAAGPVVLECRTDVVRRVLTVINARRTRRERRKTSAGSAEP